MESQKGASQENVLLTALEQVGTVVDAMQALLSQLEVALQSQRQRQPAPVFTLVAGDDPSSTDHR